MYYEDDVYNDVMGVGKTALNAPKKVFDGIQNISRTVDSLDKLIDTVKRNFVFTGQGTDLRFFESCKEMPVSMIESIPDERLKNAVKDEFSKAALSGKVNISDGKITITPKGQEYINKPQFQSAATQDLSNVQGALSEVKGFALNGTEQDLHYFAYADSLDMKVLYSHPDTETVTKIIGNIQKMKENGLVKIENATVKATEKGQAMISKAASQGALKSTVSVGTATAKGAATTGTAVASNAAVTGGVAAASGSATGGIGAVVVVVADVAIEATKIATKAALNFFSGSR